MNMNCQHDPSGWCIDCVTDLQEENDKLKTQRDERGG
jgi:hypothetical protein